MFGTEMEKKDNNNTENFAWVLIAFYFSIRIAMSQYFMWEEKCLSQMRKN
jgi:hypothetical protein